MENNETKEQSIAEAVIMLFTGSQVAPSIRELFMSGAKFGASHISTSKGMVELDKVVEIIETTAKEYAAEIDLDLLSKKGIEYNEICIQLLTDLLTEIKALK